MYEPLEEEEGSQFLLEDFFQVIQAVFQLDDCKSMFVWPKTFNKSNPRPEQPPHIANPPRLAPMDGKAKVVEL